MDVAQSRSGPPEADSRMTILRRDLVAGLTVAAVALPQGMAYALIAGVDPRYGIYTAVVMAFVGSLFGSSSHLINGPTNAISLVVFSAIAGLGLQADNMTEIVRAVFLLTLMVGGMQIVIALLKLGDLTRYISESVILGFMTGAGILIALSQIPLLLGLSTQGDGHQHLLYRLWLTITQGGQPQTAAVLLGVGTMAVVLLLKRIGRRIGVPIPEMLVALILASVVAWWMGWKDEWPPFPPGLPSFALPTIQLDWVRQLTGSALAIAVLGLLEALAIAKSIATRTREPLDYNRQCLAEGLANIAGGLFQCIPGSGSLTRSAINYQAGAVTRLSGIFSACGVGLALLFFTPLAGYVPKPALAGILLVTAYRLVDRARIRSCLRASRFDAAIALSTAGAAIFLSIEFSILIGTFLSFLFFVPRAARLQSTELIVSTERVVRERRDSDVECGKFVIYSLEGELFFGAAPQLEACFDRLRTRTEAGVRVVILRLKRARNADMVCLDSLERFLREMQEKNVSVLLCGVRGDLAQALYALGFFEWFPEKHLFQEEKVESSTLDAVRYGYVLLGRDLCETCPRRQELEPEKGEWYYMI